MGNVKKVTKKTNVRSLKVPADFAAVGNVKKVTKKTIKTIKDIPNQELLSGGTFACGGCQAIYGARLALKALGKNTIMVNTSGCMTLTAVYPFTPYKIPWVHNAIENGASTATGILMGLKALKKDKNTNIVVYAGDGATYDIGFQSLSGMVSRNEKIIFICYNNGTFGNTGFQKSSATPYGANTSTTPAGTKEKIGNIFKRKNIVKIMHINGAAYSATASTSHPIDFINKLKKASKAKGPAFIDLLCPCIPGWGIEESQGSIIGEKLVESGMWPLYEIEKNHNFKITYSPKLIPVKEAIKEQKRFRHLDSKQIKELQNLIKNEWKKIKSNKFWETNLY